MRMTWDIWLPTGMRMRIVVFEDLKTCDFYDLCTFVAKFFRRDLCTFSAEFWRLKKRNPQTESLLECMLTASIRLKQTNYTDFDFADVYRWLSLRETRHWKTPIQLFQLFATSNECLHCLHLRKIAVDWKIWNKQFNFLGNWGPNFEASYMVQCLKCFCTNLLIILCPLFFRG